MRNIFLKICLVTRVSILLICLVSLYSKGEGENNYVDNHYYKQDIEKYLNIEFPDNINKIEHIKQINYILEIEMKLRKKIEKNINNAKPLPEEYNIMYIKGTKEEKDLEWHFDMCQNDKTKILSICEFLSGQRTKVFVYYCNGNLKYTYKYRNGVPTGIKYEFTHEGFIKSIQDLTEYPKIRNIAIWNKLKQLDKNETGKIHQYSLKFSNYESEELIIKKKKNRERHECMINISKIDEAKMKWFDENNADPQKEPTKEEIMPYLENKFPECPCGGIYKINNKNNYPTCTIHGTYFGTKIKNNNKQ